MASWNWRTIVAMLRAGLAEDRITMQAGAPYRMDAICPRWIGFLYEVFGQDGSVVDWWQRVAGYCLTGSMREQLIFLLYGKGSNGKSTMLRWLRRAMGDYAIDTAFSTWEASPAGTIPSDLARLENRRLCTASETKENSKLNEGRLKSIAGGDPVTARYLYGEWFTFAPMVKVMLAVNHKPKVADDSFGFWRKCVLVPFTQSFDPQTDPELDATLEPQWRPPQTTTAQRVTRWPTSWENNAVSLMPRRRKQKTFIWDTKIGPMSKLSLRKNT
jgi:putative DNA primase/helicase